MTGGIPNGISVPREVAQAVLDIACWSMDFASGFLDDEEVVALRTFAEAIGADPWTATPDNHRPKYCPDHQWEVCHSYFGGGKEGRRCSVCRLTEWPS